MGTITPPQAGINLADQNHHATAWRTRHGGPDPARPGSTDILPEVDDGETPRTREWTAVCARQPVALPRACGG